MKNNIYKKLLSFFTLIALVSGNLVFTVSSALTTIQPIGTIKPINTQVVNPTSGTIGAFKAVKPAYNPKFVLDKKVGSFMVNTKAITNKQILELAPITSANAGKVLNTWTINSSFNKNFVIKPTGTNYNFLVMKLDEKGLKESLEKTNFAKQVYSQYKGVSGGLGKLVVQTPKMQRFPDRLVLTSKTQIKFKTLKEFENIKKYYKLDSKDVISALSKKSMTMMPKTGLTNAGVFQKSLASKKDLVNNGKVAGTKLSSEVERNFFKDLFDGCVRNSTCRTQLAKELKKPTSELRKTHRFSKQVLYIKYNTKYDDAIGRMLLGGNEENVIETTEKIEMSLLPVDPLSSANFNNNLRIAPNMVRISGTKINNIFKNIEKVSKIGTQLQEVDDNSTSNDVKKICNKYEGTEKSACLKLAETYVNPKTKKYEKILINGITLGNEYHYNFHRKWRKKFGRGRFSKTVTIYEVNVDLSFGYGFGIRIPIKTEIEINKDSIKVGANANEKKFKAKISVKTINANAQQYRDAGIHPTQIFDGKEFVFTVYAYLEGKLILANSTVFHQKFDLIRLLGILLGISGLHSFDKSKDFIPPYNGENKISLFEKEYGIEIYKKNYALGGGTLFADLLFEAWIDGYITAYCKAINAIGSDCNKKMYFGKTASHILGFNTGDGISADATQTIELEARNTGTSKEDLLGNFNEYGIILKDFKYIPQLVATIKSRARLHYWYDVKVRDGSGDISTPRYEVYRFTLDLPALGAHVGYGLGGTYNLTEEQKQIKATGQKIYSKLKTNFYEGLVLILPIYKTYVSFVGIEEKNSDNSGKGKTPGKGENGKNDGKFQFPGNGKNGTDEQNGENNENGTDENNYEDADEYTDENPGDHGSGYNPAPGEDEEETVEDNDDDYYPGVEWRPTEEEIEEEEEIILDESTDFSRGGLLSGKWMYPEDLELRFVPKTAISFVQNFFKKRTPAKRAKLYSQILMMLETYENNPVLKVKKEKLIRILKDLRDIMVVYRLR